LGPHRAARVPHTQHRAALGIVHDQQTTLRAAAYAVLELHLAKILANLGGSVRARRAVLERDA
jgi:hypothetical protein